MNIVVFIIKKQSACNLQTAFDILRLSAITIVITAWVSSAICTICIS